MENKGLIEATMSDNSYLLLKFRLICLIKPASQRVTRRWNGEINFEGKVYKIC